MPSSPSAEVKLGPCLLFPAMTHKASSEPVGFVLIPSLGTFLYMPAYISASEKGEDGVKQMEKESILDGLHCVHFLPFGP